MLLHVRPHATGVHLARLATIAGEVTPALHFLGQLITAKESSLSKLLHISVFLSELTLDTV